MDMEYLNTRIDDMYFLTDESLLLVRGGNFSDESIFAAACLLMASESNERKA